jgi:hypothetical protein
MIDELERVRRFRSEEPPPFEEVRLEASAALARAIHYSKRPHPRPRPHPERRRRRTRRRLIRAALVVASIAAGMLVVELAGSGSDTGPPSAAAAALEQLARVAASGPSLVPGPGQYLYVDSVNDYPAIADGGVGKPSCITSATDHRQIWIGANGSGLLRDTTGPTTFTSPRDRAVCLAMNPSPLTGGGTSNLWFANRCFQLGPTDDMQALSTDPRTLLVQMRRLDGGPVTPAEDFVHIGDFMRETDASPALRAALYRAAALIPGVRLLGTVPDHLGRTGLGVAYDAPGVRHELIFNPRTSELMGEQDSGSPGADWAVYLQTRVVDQLAQTPPTPLSPPCGPGGAGYTTHTTKGDVQTGRAPQP